MANILIAALAYLLPTFAIAYFWHMRLFADRYKALEIYRDDPIVPFGFASMLIQSAAFALIYHVIIAPNFENWLARALLYAVFGALLSWSFTTLAAAAKNRMNAIGGFIAIETAFTARQWVAVGLATALRVG